MTDKQFVAQLGKDYNAVLEDAKRYGYDVNEPQFNKLNDIVKVLQSHIKQFGGEIESLDLNPLEIHGGVTANFVVLHLYGDNLIKFATAIKEASAVTFDCTNDSEVCISITVPDVFKKID